jgi:zinc transporter ZupT
MSEQIIMNMVSLVLGIMLFFSFILAPMIFKVLPPDNAGVFIRAIFPYYYLVNLLILGLVSGFYIFYQTFILDFYLVLTSALLFFFNLVYLMPKINKLKDERNEKAFKISHFISVVINFAQLVMLGIVLA